MLRRLGRGFRGFRDTVRSSLRATTNIHEAYRVHPAVHYKNWRTSIEVKEVFERKTGAPAELQAVEAALRQLVYMRFVEKSQDGVRYRLSAKGLRRLLSRNEHRVSINSTPVLQTN